MFAFASKSKGTRSAVSANPPAPRRVHFGHGREASSSLTPLTAHFKRDFGPVHTNSWQIRTGNEMEQRRSIRLNTFTPGSGSENSVAPPGEAMDEESTVPDGGTKSPPPPPPPTYCQATPTSASIKNVTKTSSGKLYGHEFDFVVDLTYSKLGSTATKDEDATLEWFEKTSRPPAWQTVIKKDTWNDMFALYPTSPTFDGWTKNRTKPCPGKETATIHDTPNASVDLPARTLEFNLKVTGGGVTKSATATQVLEPDGKGGIKTQTFT